jgi:ABC-type lipoprotein export system ATPase subunit
VTIVMVTHNDELGARAKRRIRIQDGRMQNGHSLTDHSGIQNERIGVLDGGPATFERRRA